jgi:hypothetical protein
MRRVVFVTVVACAALVSAGALAQAQPAPVSQVSSAPVSAPAVAAAPQADQAQARPCVVTTWRMTGDGVRIRSAPNLHARVRGAAYRGDLIGVDDQTSDGSWVHLEDFSRIDPNTGKPVRGWVCGAYVQQVCEV